MSFSDPPDDDTDPRAIIARHIAAFPEFETLRIAEAKITVFMRSELKMKGGKRVLGMLALPSWQGVLAPLAEWLLAEREGHIPDYLMILDAEWWERASQLERDALVHHELKHAMQALDRDGEPRFTAEGLPVWAIREHDLAEFNDTVRRFGVWQDDIREFLGAARENRV